MSEKSGCVVPSSPQSASAAAAMKTPIGTPAVLARRISEHHQVCAVCRAGGRLAVGPGGLRRVPCGTERALFAALEKATTQSRRIAGESPANRN